MPIFFTFDNNYVVPAAVAFFSLVNRAKKGVRYELFVLHHDIMVDNQVLLKRVSEQFGNASLTFIDTGDFLIGEWSAGNWEGHAPWKHFTADTVVRCFGARFFPQYDKIIYSDVDVVFQDDISELMDVDISDVYCAGVRGYIRYDKTNMSHLKPEHYEMLKDCYLAGGIWVMNLKKIREDNLEARMLEIIRDDTIVKRWNDQDVMNIACAGKVRFLPLNYIGYPSLRDSLMAGPFDSPYTRDELYDSIIRPKIMHYAAQKPWKTRTDWDVAWWDIAHYLNLHVKELPVHNDNGLDERIKALKRVKRRWRLFCIIQLIIGLCVVAYGILRTLKCE